MLEYKEGDWVWIIETTYHRTYSGQIEDNINLVVIDHINHEGTMYKSFLHRPYLIFGEDILGVYT